MSSFLRSITDNLCKLSGEDFAIIKQCSRDIQKYFIWIGTFVFIILICCFLSAMYFIEHLFHSKILDVGVGFVWGYIVTNMYVLLLYTITPALLPIKEKEKSEKFNLSFSLGLRIFIMSLLAIITAQPLCVFLLQHQSVGLAYDIKFLLAHNPLSTVITGVVIAIFMLPIYLKYRLRNIGEFYKRKKDIKQKFVEDDYRELKQEYKKLLELKISEYNRTVWTNLYPYLEKLKIANPNVYQHYYQEIEKELTNESVEKYEYWADPPYRTQKKQISKNALSEYDLLQIIYPMK